MDTLTIAGRSFHPRLILGPGKYRSPQVVAECHRVSGAEIITVAVRRVRHCNGREDSILQHSILQHSILQHLDGHSYFLLPNTAGCRTAEQAVPTAHLAREAGFSHCIKLEVIGDDHTLFPDNEYDAVPLNTAVASARDSLAMARALRHAVIAGRLAFEARRMGRLYANASSPAPDFSGPNPFPAATFQEFSSRQADRGAPNAG
jgi:thiazole synthase ThiGH ThiG subunit